MDFGNNTVFKHQKYNDRDTNSHCWHFKKKPK